jgi:hypothetical protein
MKTMSKTKSGEDALPDEMRDFVKRTHTGLVALHTVLQSEMVRALFFSFFFFARCLGNICDFVFFLVLSRMRPLSRNASGSACPPVSATSVGWCRKRLLSGAAQWCVRRCLFVCFFFVCFFFFFMLLFF